MSLTAENQAELETGVYPLLRENAMRGWIGKGYRDTGDTLTLTTGVKGTELVSPEGTRFILSNSGALYSAPDLLVAERSRGSGGVPIQTLSGTAPTPGPAGGNNPGTVLLLVAGVALFWWLARK